MGLTKPRASQIYNLDYKQATRVVATTNITLAGGAPSQVDGVNLSANDRILVTAQTTGSQNGLYVVTTVGSGGNGTWVRTSDGNETGEIEAGMIIMVTEGAIYQDTQWKLITDNPIVIGTTALTFTQNYSANSISGGTSNVTVYSNSTVNISSAGTANVVIISNTGAYVAGAISATGNITGNYILGNGSQLTGVTATSVGVLPSLSVTGNTVSGNISTGGQLSVALVGSNLIPTANVTYSLGNTTNRWANLWLSNSTIYLGNVAVSATNTGLTVNGANVITADSSGDVSSAGNITGGNVLTSGMISASGNIIGPNIAIDRGPDTDNWDNLINMGTYSVNLTSWSGVTGAPVDSTVYVGLLSVLTSGTTTTQTFYPGTVTTNNVKIQWDRTLYSGTWTSWYKIVNDFQVVDAGSY